MKICLQSLRYQEYGYFLLKTCFSFYWIWVSLWGWNCVQGSKSGPTHKWSHYFVDLLGQLIHETYMLMFINFNNWICVWYAWIHILKSSQIFFIKVISLMARWQRQVFSMLFCQLDDSQGLVKLPCRLLFWSPVH